MAEVGGCQPVPVEAWVRAQASLCKICSGQSGSGKGFSPSALIIIFVVMLRTLLHLIATVMRRISEESNVVSTVWKPWTELCLHCFFSALIVIIVIFLDIT